MSYSLYPFSVVALWQLYLIYSIYFPYCILVLVPTTIIWYDANVRLKAKANKGVKILDL